ncbi:GerAB/ArcD/ProY family transporter [Effusibacillus dendaii]|uniref:Spore germination protein YndE n=1 Tax=Effusibacillus dendaii TaxID=2743772 RepID=A0A7I8DBX2_9BACL|nr:endospore germination permease [Effusibacillus dendaii]BCJ86832.1 spore germination protein YndE [Effusibacillus dendaii]
MQQPNRDLQFNQVFITLASAMIGVRLLVLPRTLTEEAGTPDIWISNILGMLIGITTAGLVGLFPRMFREKDFFQFVPMIVGRIPGYVLTTGYILYVLSFISNELRSTAEVIQFYLMHRTPVTVIALVMLLTAIYLVKGGMHPVVYIQQMFFPIIVVVILLLMVFVWNKTDFQNLRPVLGEGFLPVLKAVPETAFAVLGFEMIMIFGAYMKHPKEALKSAVCAILSVNLLNILVVVFAVLMFDGQTLKTILYPVVEIAKEVEVPGGFLERLESVFLTIWVMTIFSTIAIGLFIASHGVEQLYGMEQSKNVVFLVPVVTLVALWPKNLADVFDMGTVVENVGIFFVGTVPAVLFLAAKLRGVGQSSAAKSATKGSNGQGRSKRIDRISKQAVQPENEEETMQCSER